MVRARRTVRADDVPIASVARHESQAMAKATVEVLVDDLDGSAAAETIHLGWNGEWRELDLSKRNLASLSKALDRYWNAGHPVSGDGTPTRRKTARASRPNNTSREPKRIRAWATERGIEVPSRGRIPAEVERQFNEAHARR